MLRTNARWRWRVIGVCTLGAAAGVFVAASTAIQTGESDLIPREKLFGNPERASPRLSPDGRHLAFRAPRDGVMNVWVAPIGELERAIPVTADRTTGISEFFWAYDNRHLLYLQDNNGDEDFHLYAVTLEGKDARDLTPLEKISAQVIAVGSQHPDWVLVGINDRDEHYFHDVYRIDIATGERTSVVKNPGYAGFVADERGRVRLAIALTPEAEMTIDHSDGLTDSWSPLLTIGAEDLMTTSPAGFDLSGDVLYLADSRGRDTAAFKTLNLKTGELRELFGTDRADVEQLVVHPTLRHVQALTYNHQRPEWVVLDESIRGDLDYLQGLERGDLSLVSRTEADDEWVVAYDADNGPIKYYLYERKARRARFLFSHRPELESLPLATMRSEIIEARDGLSLVSYLTLPREADGDGDGRPERALPMVLLVHGGPWARDEWGFDPLHQLLANRGYAVLSVNYRGSTGFGKSFINAANGEWAGKMHDDLIDAVEWAVGQGIAAPDRVAIMGGSYGGYATLVGLTFTPETFACGVDIVGPSSLISLMENPPPYWMPMMPLMKARVGDWTTDEGREFLKARSPLFRAGEIRRPLLIGQGAQDPRVKQAESDQIVSALQRQNIPVSYLLYPEEGHGFDRPENNLSFFAVTEHFLAKHLGGRAEPIGAAFERSGVEIPVGADQVPGVAESLQAAAAGGGRLSRCTAPANGNGPAPAAL